MRKAYTDGAKSIGKKVDFVAVLTDITRREAEEAFIHTAKMAAIEITLKYIHKKKFGNIYKLS